ncbi:hypothetical protein BJY52DRAFT_1246184, partial [Lactarius psammicola]
MGRWQLTYKSIHPQVVFYLIQVKSSAFRAFSYHTPPSPTRLPFIMRPTTVLSFLVASMAVLSQSPAVYAAPIPTELDSAETKRGCTYIICRTAELPTTNDSSQTPLLKLVTALIDTLTSIKTDMLSTNTTSPVELASAAVVPLTEIDIVDVVDPDAS